MLGTCQGAAVAQALPLLLPRSEVVYYTLRGITKRFPRVSDLLRDFDSYDVVFANQFATAFRDGGDFEALRGHSRVVQIPNLVFSAFHPDVVYVGDVQEMDGRGLVRSATGPYNSALTLFGFLEGLSVDATARLFTPDVFRRLGYLDQWDDSAATLLSLGCDASYDLSESLVRWARRGAFMHTINHPKMYVTSDLARGLLAKAGIPFADCDLDSYLVDDFVHQGTWPIYEPIAELFGVKGSYVFLKRGPKPGGPPVTIDLRAFIAGSFASYRRRDITRLAHACARVAAWRADGAIRTGLKEAAA